LEIMSRQALASRPEELEKLARERRLALDYARFRAGMERGGTDFPAADLRDPNVLYHFYGQMLAEGELAEASRAAAERGVRFYFDLPLGVHGSGFDTWSAPTLFARRAEVGAPPDAVFPDGQRWGFPPILPEESRREGHRHLRECLAHTMRHAGLLRVDHIMGIHRQFWIPAGFEKRQGVYVRYPAEELYATANIESHRHRCELVGENLGIVPRAVNRAIERHLWRGIYVLPFSLTGERGEPVTPAPANVVASLNTHDTPTFAGFRRCRDLDERVEAGFLDRAKADELCRSRAAAIAVLDSRLELDEQSAAEPTRESLARWIELLLRSEADLVSLNLEDLWLEEEPQNVPGRVDRPNWRRKLLHSLSSLPPDVVSMLAGISRRA
ncbi:MAG: 4-alpha-glucanotransferase, partial [Vicinamibacteria bacterium]